MLERGNGTEGRALSVAGARGPVLVPVPDDLAGVPLPEEHVRTGGQLTFSEACDLCQAAAHLNRSVTVLLREPYVSAIMDPQPVSTGHVVVFPVAHAQHLWQLDAERSDALWSAVQQVSVAAARALRLKGLTLIHADGIRASTAHLRVDLIPRWYGHRVRPSWADEIGRVAAAIRADLNAP